MVRHKRKDKQQCQQQHELAGGNDATTTEASTAATTTTAKYARQHEVTGGAATNYSNATTGTAKTSESHELGDRKREGIPNATIVVRKRRQPATTNSGKLVATESKVKGSTKSTVDAIQSTIVPTSDLVAALSEIVRPSARQCSTKREDDSFWPA